MMYCRNCGAELKEKFCGSCGTSAEDQPLTLTSSATGMPDNLAAAMCYIPLLGGLAFLFLAPYNTKKRIRFNAFQALLVFGAYILAGWGVEILQDIQWELGRIVANLVRLSFLGVSLLCAFKAFNNQDFEIPVLGDFARKHA